MLSGCCTLHRTQPVRLVVCARGDCRGVNADDQPSEKKHGVQAPCRPNPRGRLGAWHAYRTLWPCISNAEGKINSSVRLPCHTTQHNQQYGPLWIAMESAGPQVHQTLYHSQGAAAAATFSFSSRMRKSMADLALGTPDDTATGCAGVEGAASPPAAASAPGIAPHTPAAFEVARVAAVA